MLPVLSLGALLATVSPTGFTAATAQRIDAIATNEILARRTPGIAIGIIQDGRLVYARGYGKANVGRNIPVSPGTQFGIGQISEQFTAASILLLEQDGKLKLGDPVTKYVPELTIASHITIRQLLQETSGLPDVSTSPHIPRDRTRYAGIDMLIAAINSMQLASQPGTAYADNPLNYLLAGLIIERITGVPISDYVQQHIFLPLVMDSSLYAGDTGISPTHALGYTLQGNNNFVQTRAWSVSRLRGEAGVVSNVYDLSKWDIEYPILLRVDAVREMLTPSTPGNYEQHGMGWVIDQRDGRRFIWQDGQIAGYHAMNALLPDDHIGVIVLTNADSFGGPAVLPETVAGRILDVIVPPTAERVDNTIIARAREWLERLATLRIDRTQLTPTFSSYLTDSYVHDARFASLGTVESIVPISSTNLRNGDTSYEFLAHFSQGTLHYRFTLAPDGKIDYLDLTP